MMPDREATMARRRGGDREERLRKQREYQREYRKRIKEARVPDRDEIAREMLHYAITENLRLGRGNKLGILARSIVERLVARGYDQYATRRAFIAIVHRYQAGWSFQRKLHLDDQNEGALEGDD
jgi:hypothetical protein